MFMEAAVTNIGFVVRRAGPCTLKGYTVFYLSTLLLFFSKQRPAVFFFLIQDVCQSGSPLLHAVSTFLFVHLSGLKAAVSEAVAAQKAAAGRP